MKILLLQAPFGWFFKHARYEFEKKGHEVFKISFNGGDWANSGFYGDKYIKNPLRFREYLKKYLKINEIGMVVAFGDCRYYHRIAALISKKKNIPFIALEEGYLRPHYITIDAEGLNARSKTDFFEEDEHALNLSQFGDDYISRDLFMSKTPHVIAYYVAKFIFSPMFPLYHHHRTYSIFREAYHWIKSGRRKLMSSFKEQDDIKKLTDNAPFYFVPLQVHNDSQIKYHSKYMKIEDFIEEVLKSFAEEAPKENHIVLKHHPMDRGFKSYKKFVSALSNDLGIKNRVHIITDFNIPNLLRNCIGCININSSVGLSAIIHGKPTITMGNCFFNIKDITHQDGLEIFWSNPKPPKTELKKLMLSNIRKKTQVNGSFYDYSHRNIHLCVDTILKRAEKHWDL